MSLENRVARCSLLACIAYAQSSYYESLLATLKGKRALLEEGVRRAGMVPMAGQGGILCLVRIRTAVIERLSSCRRFLHYLILL